MPFFFLAYLATAGMGKEKEKEGIGAAAPYFFLFMAIGASALEDYGVFSPRKVFRRGMGKIISINSWP